MRRLPVRNFDGDPGFAYYADGQQIASIFVWKTAEGPAIHTVQVDRAFRERGLGTKLYKAAADLACRKFKAPLLSDASRSGYAQAFWEKQVRKGRAVCVKPHPDPHIADRELTVAGRGGCWRYRLTCPAPRSLAGAVRKSPKRTRR